MLDKIVIQDKFGNKGFYLFTDAIKSDNQRIKIEEICFPNGEKVDVGGQTMKYWKWFTWFMDYRMWINGVEWDKMEQQRKQDYIAKQRDEIEDLQHEKDTNMSEQRRKAWAKREHDRIIDMGLDRSDADGNL